MLFHSAKACSLRPASSPALGGCALGPTRSALTLLEVVIALAIFLIAMVPIWSLVSMGGERALDIKLQTQASLLCQSKLDAVKAGAEQLNSSGSVNVGGVDWQYTIDSSGTDVENLHQVRVTAKYERPDGKINEASLVQLVFDPNQRGSTIAASTATTATTGGN